MKRLLLSVGIFAVVSVMAILAYCLFISGSSFTGNTGYANGSAGPEERVVQLERRIRDLSTRLNESEKRVALWEDAWQAGEAPEYYRERFGTAGMETGYRQPGGYKPGGAEAQVSVGKPTLEHESKDTYAHDGTGRKVPVPGITIKKNGHSSDKNTSDEVQKEGQKEPRYVGGLLGMYYQGRNFDELKLVMTDYEIDFDFADRSPDRIITEDDYSIRWVGYIRIETEADYSFHTLSDDGVRLWVGGHSLINNWGDHSATLNTGKIKLKKGYHALRLDFYERGGVATVKLYWSSQGVPMEIIPSAHLYHDLDLEEKVRKEVH